MHLSRLPARLVLAFAFLAAFLPGHAAAHVKWFCGPVDLTAAPRGLGAVLSGTFLADGIVFLTLVAAGGLIDALVARRWPRRGPDSRRRETVEELLIRLGVAWYAIGLWDNTAMVPWGAGADGAILTPELLDRDRLVGMVQLAVALLLAFRRTCPLAALGLVALYGVGVARYGVFHMTDYVYFLGLAAYLALTAPRLAARAELRRWRVPLLAGSLAFSLMWTAIEKFLYPAWTEIVLAGHPDLTLGLPPPFVVVTAGFVEFSLAFYLLVGRDLLRLAAFALIVVFVSAIPEFGELDYAGHLPIVTILVVAVLHGSPAMREAAWPRDLRPVRSAALVGGLYVVSFAAMTAMYYGLQQTAGWH